MVALVAAILVAPVSSAATYFVNNRAPLASDNSPGTETQPWRTIGKASRTVKPGDRVVVRPGVYPERVNFKSGNLSNATQRTIFEAWPRQRATMYGFDTLNAPNIVIRGFDITIPQSLLSIDWTARYAVFIRSKGVQVTHNMVRDVAGIGISSYSGQPWVTDVGIFLNTVRRCNQGIVIYGHNWRVGSNHVNQLVRYDMDADYMRFFGKDIVIRRNYLHGARLSEVGISHVDGFQTFPNNGYYAENVLIDGNYVESFHQGAIVGVIQHAQMTGYLRNISFTNNVFIGGEIGGSWGILGLDVQNLYVQNNLIKDLASFGTGVGIREFSTAVVQNNAFFNAGENYYHDATSNLVGGYNMMNREKSTPLYRNKLDILKDPLMWNSANTLGADRWPWTADDGYQLRDVSPARDAGGGATVPRDIFLKGRPQGSGHDMGPHEYPVTAAKSNERLEALMKNVTTVSGYEPIEIGLSNVAPIDTESLWADVPVPFQGQVRVEWDYDQSRPNDVWVRIVPLATWERLATAFGLAAAPFEVGIGNDDLQSGKLLFSVSTTSEESNRR